MVSYLNKLLMNPENLAYHVKHAAGAAERYGIDSLVIRGMSSAIIAPAVAHKLGLQMLVLRKPGENTHDSAESPGKFSKRMMFIDDFTVSGKTLQTVAGRVANGGGRLLGVYFWDHFMQEQTPRFAACGHIEKLNVNALPILRSWEQEQMRGRYVAQASAGLLQTRLEFDAVLSDEWQNLVRNFLPAPEVKRVAMSDIVPLYNPGINKEVEKAIWAPSPASATASVPTVDYRDLKGRGD